MRTADHVLAMRIQEGSAGYGVYVMLLELLRDSETRRLVMNPANLAFAINEPDTGLVSRVIQDYGLFETAPDGTFSSTWLETQLKEYDAKKAAAAEAGRRGAAKRYGKPIPAEGADDRVPIGSPCPPLSVPHGNITQYNNTKEINSTKSKLLGLTWGDMSGEDLFRLARGLRTDLDDITRQWAEGKQKELDRDRGAGKHNLGALLEVADHFDLSQEVFTWLLKFTNLGETGRPPMVRLMKVYHEAISTKFKPKYAAEYVICKLLEP
jgi:hypothetical protein